MAEKNDFESAWLAKLSGCLEKVAGEEIRTKVMAGSEGLSSDSGREDVIAWSKEAMERLESLAGTEKGRAIMAGCACQYPKSDLQEARQTYEETGDICLVHQMLQNQFEAFLRDTLELEDALIAEVVGRGWGLAGIWEGDAIVATKIPKSGNLVAYVTETDPEKKRQIYCHCPRIRKVLKTSDTIPPVYCYCGAGFYKGIWEEILQQPVDVELLESVLQGDDVCKVAIHLPTP